MGSFDNVGVQYAVSRGCEDTSGSIRFYALSYTFRNSSLEIPACVSIVRKVEPLIVRWLGMVKGVRVPSVFSRIIEM
jgi:hypothetical protein